MNDIFPRSRILSLCSWQIILPTNLSDPRKKKWRKDWREKWSKIAGWGTRYGRRCRWTRGYQWIKINKLKVIARKWSLSTWKSGQTSVPRIHDENKPPLLSSSDQLYWDYAMELKFYSIIQQTKVDMNWQKVMKSILSPLGIFWYVSY